ncbi:hypothetical protein H2200_000039 [Cladophialophora chaetospira]|uniref:Uncharacterized protein n=1 Tax=Cladophialophora chaetospira TaxID=386627 RepID=A0AA38XN03_9EURO|nr:hypothetical protein H2200_000039 [Cladophialophora chaetospira]
MMGIQDIPQKLVPALAKLLQFRPNEDRIALAQRLTDGAKTLPSGVRSSRWEKLLLPARGHLCQLHKCIHYDVVQAVLHHVKIEVGYRLNQVISDHNMLAPEQYSRILRLRELHALWLTPSEYYRTFKSGVEDLKWKYQHDQCEGCILSQITGDLQILLDLRWAFRSRATRAFEVKYGNPRLQNWVTVWIATLAPFVERATQNQVDLDLVLLDNESEAVELRKIRAAVATKKLLDKYRRGERLDGAYVSEVPTDFSYPIRYAPHQPKPPPAEETLEIQPEDYVGDADEAHLEGMDPYEALTSTTYLPSTANPQQVRHSSSSADQSTKGHNPHLPSQSARNSTATVHAHSTHSVVEDYIPPRSQWRKPLPQEAAKASSTLLPSPTTARSRPASVNSRDSWEQSTISSRGSWHTEVCKPDDASSSIYSSPFQNTHATPSQSYLSLSRVAQEQAKNGNAPRRRRHAESYTDLVGDAPFSDSNSTLRAPQAQQSEAGSSSQVCSETKRSAQSASTLFVSLFNEVSRPLGSGTSLLTHQHNSSATTLRQADVTPSAVSRPDSPTTPRAAKPPRPMSVVSDADTLGRLYSEIVECYKYTPGEASGATSASTLTKQKATPGALRPKKTQSESQYDEKISRIVADITRGKGLDDPNEDSRSRQSYDSRGPTPSLVSATTAFSTSPDSVSTQRRSSTRHSKPVRRDREKVKGDSGSDESERTTWSGGYRSQVQSREDLDWYYEKDKHRRRK